MLRGQLECLGAILNDDDERETEIYSPKGSSLLSVKCSLAENSASIAELRTKLNALSGLKDEDKEKILKLSSQDNYSVLLITKLDQNWMSKLRKISTDPFYTDTKNGSEMEVDLNVNLIQGQIASGVRYYEEFGQWKSALESAEFTLQNGIPLKIMTLGGKGVGKSTFNRYLVNKLLRMSDIKRVLYIDLDPGQAEFTNPGCLSLKVISDPVLGPNFTHLDCTTEYCLYLGEVNVSNCKHRYLTCLRLLRKKADSEFGGLPWIINSMGFVKGLGLHLLEEAVKSFKPSTVINIQSRFPVKNVPDSFPPLHPAAGSSSYNVLTFPAIPESDSGEDGWGVPHPRKLRDLALLSYFARYLLRGDHKQVTFDFVGIQLLTSGLTDYKDEDVLSLVNGSLCALSTVPADDVRPNPGSNLGLRLVHNDVVVHVSGFALIKAVDLPAKKFILDCGNTSLDRLKGVNCLTVGSIAIPEAILLNQKSSKSEKKPYLSNQVNFATPLQQPVIRSHKFKQ